MKIGLFFGSFNPIHIGHLALANYFLEFSDINRLWFVVSPQNPLKKREVLLDDYQRLHIVRSCIEDYEPDFQVCSIEFDMPKPSYTIDTMTYLKEKYPDFEFVIITGADNLLTISKWKNYQELINKYVFYVYPRIGNELQNIDKNIKYKVFNAPQIEISSSFIRNSIKEGKNVDFFLHPKAAKYINEMNFYKK